MVSEEMDADARTFAVLRALTMIGGLAAVLLVPPRAEHQVHLLPLLLGAVTYKVALFAALLLRPGWSRPIFLATLGVDLILVFLLVWFTGGGESHFHVLFYLLVALNAYYFGPAVGAVAATLSSALLALANVLAPPAVDWAHIASRAALLGLLGLALGHFAARERAARDRAERLNRELADAIATLEQARRELVRAEQLATVGRVSTKLAHEVNNPISAIGLNVELLDDLVKGGGGAAIREEAAELLAAIRVQIRALADLTKEYLTLARLPRARLEEDSLNELVQQVLALVRPLAGRQHVALEARLDPVLPLVPFDRGLLRQAVLNLVKNALEVVPRGGRVVVQTRALAEAVEVGVTDSGPGVAPEAVARLFEPFFTTKAHGTGLGLAIARQVVEEHQGTLAWANVVAGGASFVIRLPVKAPSHA